MSGEYHGWDEESDGWTFATVTGEKSRDGTFVIVDFGGCSSRQALSAIMCATQQFDGQVHLRKTEHTRRLIDQLAEAKVVRIAPVTAEGDHEEVGVLGVRSKPPPPKQPWWKFWK